MRARFDSSAASPSSSEATRWFELVASPAQPVAGAIDVRAFVERDGTMTPWPAKIDVSPLATVRLSGDTDVLFGPQLEEPPSGVALRNDQAEVLQGFAGAEGESLATNLEKRRMGRRATSTKTCFS